MPPRDPQIQRTVPPATSSTSLMDRINVSVHFRRYFKLIARRWLVLAACVLLATGYYGYKAFKAPDVFQSHSKIGFPPKVLTPGYGMTRPQIIEERTGYIANQIRDMESAAVLSRVREKVFAENPLGQGTLTATTAQQGKGSWFELIVQGVDFQTARAFAETWAKEFIAFKEEQYGTAFGKNAVEMRAEKANYASALEEVQQQIRTFMQKHNIGTVEGSLDSKQTRYNDLERQLSDVKSRLDLLEKADAQQLATGSGAALLAPLDAPKSSASQESQASARDPYSRFETQEYRRYKLDLEAKKAEMARHNGVLRDAHPVMVRLKGEIQSLENRIQSLLNILEEQRASFLANLRLQERSLEALLKDLQSEVTFYGDLKREYETLNNKKVQLQENLSKIDEALTQIQLAEREDEQFTILESGMGSPAPIGPNRPKMVVTGLLLGLGLGLGIIYFLQRLDDRVELAQDVEDALEEPVLGQIPLIDAEGNDNRRLLITGLDQHDFFAESIRGIRSAVLFGNQPGSRQLLLVTSAVPGDGKTTFTVNFAITLASAGHRVLLVDADLRRGSTHQFFDTDRGPGLTEVLSGEIHWLDVLRESSVPNLHTIPPGAIPPNPGELLISPISQQLAEDFRKEYDYVIFDCPPVTGIDDTFSLLNFSDGVLFVVRAGQTSMRFAKNALAGIRHRGARIFGLVLNGITADNPYYYYYSYYNAYYSKLSRPTRPARANAPGLKMPPPKRRTPPSIELTARARSENKGAPADAQLEQDKTEHYRKLRARRKAEREQSAAQAASTGAEASPHSDENDSDESADPSVATRARRNRDNGDGRAES